MLKADIYRDLALSWRMLWRDGRSGELAVLLMALIIAVTCVTAVGFFVDRVERGMRHQAAELLAADLVVSASRPIRPALLEWAHRQRLRTARVVQFRSVAMTQDRPRLVEVKAVEADYPLRGRLRVADRPFGADATASGVPPRGETWVEPALQQQLGLEMGDVLWLGASRLKVTRVLVWEPDRGGQMFSVAPRVMINLLDLPATQLIQPGSLVNYRLLLGVASGDVDRVRGALRGQLGAGERLIGVGENRRAQRSALKTADRFLGVAALMSVLLAGVAVATAGRRFAARHLDTSALMRCFGATQGQVTRLFTLEMLWLALIGSSFGIGLGLLAHIGLVSLLGELLVTGLPAFSPAPLVLGYATGVILLLGFGLPPMLALRRVPPLRVLRREVAGEGVAAGLVHGAALLSMGLLMFWQLGDLELVLVIAGGMLVTLLLLGLAALGLVMLLGKARRRVGVAWRFGLANIARRRASSTLQISAFGLGIMVLLLLSIVRLDLLDSWQHSLPPQAPNHFLINLQQAQIPALQAFFQQRGLRKPTLYPMVRARLVFINGRKVRGEDYPEGRSRHLVTREFNLSWALRPRADNQIVAGRWWRPSEAGRPLISLEKGIAETLGIGLGDRLIFDISGREQVFTVSNLRKVEWETFNVNFFTLVPPGVLEQAPANWVTSLYLGPGEKPLLAELVKRFPNLTVIDVDAILSRVRRIMGRVALAVESVFLFTLLAGIAVLYAAIQAHQDERRFESAMLRTLGAGRRLIRRGLMAEFAVLGALSGLLGGLAATVLAWVLAEYVFHFSYSPDPRVSLAGVGIGVVIVGLAGLLGTRRVLDQPPLLTLRRRIRPL